MSYYADAVRLIGAPNFGNIAERLFHFIGQSIILFDGAQRKVGQYRILQNGQNYGYLPNRKFLNSRQISKRLRERYRLQKVFFSLPYMFSDEVQKISFKAPEWTSDQIVDWFGFDFRVEGADDGECIFNINASPKAMEYWAMQDLNFVEVLKPTELREKKQYTISFAKV